MAVAPCIRRMSYSELHIHPPKNYLNYSASAPLNVVCCGLLSYFHKSDSEDFYV